MLASLVAASPPPPLRILVADDEESMRHFLSRGLTRLGYQVTAVDDGAAAIARWQYERFDLGVFDLRMPGTDGLVALARIRSLDPEATIVLMSAHGTVATAVEAMHGGAADFVTKPFAIEELQLRIERAGQLRTLHQSHRQLRSLLGQQDLGLGVVADSPAMQEVVHKVELLASSAATVLLTGESGTGKGLVAKALHLRSTRAERPFLALNCAAVPDALVESELFGHEAGAFTGARAKKAGLLQRADGGTVFLDEIADMSLAAQAKIERFLQEREFVPLGATAPVAVDVRVLAATNRDLHARAQNGQFRPELLWRLEVVSLAIPPLRERREDVPALLAKALARHGEGGRPRHQLSAEALSALCTWNWPGNVRELENIVERMVVLAGPRLELGIADLPDEVRGPDDPDQPGASGYEAARRRFDRIWFTEMLQRHRGNVTDAAAAAGMSRGHLHRRLKELGLDAGGARGASE
jgi:two-component system, NtrC family, response regulator AtoC